MKVVPFLVLCFSLVGSTLASPGGTDSTVYAAGSSGVSSAISSNGDPVGAPESGAIGFGNTEGTPFLFVALLALVFLVAVGIAADKADYP